MAKNTDDWVGMSGTTVVSGRAIGLVCATGKNTRMGKITKLTVETKRTSGFEKRILTFSKFILRLILLTLAIVFVANLGIKKGNVNILELLIFSVALAISVIPEALPVVTTFSLSGGALRLAKNKVVVKRLSAIEEMGSIDVLCTDKTGTLTENKMKVAEIFCADKKSTAKDLIRYAGIAAPFMKDNEREPNNAFDLAIWAELKERDRNSIFREQKIKEVPFDPVRRRNTVLVKKDKGSFLLSRGAPEQIMSLASLDAGQKKDVTEWIKTEGQKGRRVIALSGKQFNTLEINIGHEEKDLTFFGLISFIDPLKTSAKSAISKANKLGVMVKILTGDGPEVATAVGREVGLISEKERAMTGSELENLTHREQIRAVTDNKIFARVSPEQKFKIIELLQQKHDVAFLGEGINDAPALKIANVGMVVNGASDIAREAADIVLLKSSLGVIVDGIAEGRRIFANITKYIKITMASNLGNFYAIVIALFMIDFLPMLPLQILLLNLLSDFPMIAIAADNVDAEELKKPKHYDLKDVILFSLVMGLISTVFDFIFFSLFYRISPEVLHTNWFIASVLTELALIYVVRSRGFTAKGKCPAPILLFLTIAAAVFAIAMPFLVLGRELFKFVYPSLSQIALIVALVVVYAIISEIVKLIYYKFTVASATSSS